VLNGAGLNPPGQSLLAEIWEKLSVLYMCLTVANLSCRVTDRWN
jgi:hypothetical protein